MVELFAELPTDLKIVTGNIIDYIFNNFEPQQCAHLVADLANNCENKELENFIDFYFKLKLEKIKNESDND